MATPFVPVPVPNQLRSAGCRTRPSRTSTPSTSSGCSPPGRTPWVRPSGTMADCHSPTQPGFSPEEDYGGRTRGNRVEDGALPSSILGDGGVKDGWMERPTTPTLLGYEVMEERAKFTVYKILVTGHRGESWVIFRRYTDFSRLNDKLKEIFPRFRLSLPPKRWFRDNYDTEFLEDRQIGLQTFLQNLLAHKDIINSEVVRQFLCLDDPPGPFDSLEESRAFCETLEETNHRLQRELLEKQREISSLRAELQDRDTQLCLLEQRLSGKYLSPDYCESPCHQSAAGAESSGYAEPEPIEHGPTDTSPDRPTDTSPDGHTDTSPDGHTDIDKNGGGDQMSSISKTDQDSMLKTSCESCGPEKGCGAYWNTLTINASPIAS